MRWLFATIAVGLVLASAGIIATQPGAQSEVPIIYFGTGTNPFRIKDVELFHQWLIDNDKPKVELRLDVAQSGDKSVIQGVSGVASDILQVPVPWYQQLGLIEDVTDAADSLGFDVSKTWPALEPLLTVDGRQYGFPANVTTTSFWVNLETFEALGMAPPPRHWDIPTFEAIGREFVERANEAGKPRAVYFADDFTNEYLLRTLHRTFGTSVFNETMTRSTLGEQGFVRAMELLYKWTYKDHLFPSAAEKESFAAAGGFIGSSMSLLNDGTFGMVSIGRWCLVRLRQFDDPPRVGVSFFPHAEFPNCVIDTRVVAVYAGSKHKPEATLFLAFMAAKEYNEHIVRIADALPPLPEHTRTELYRRPVGHENEWGAHEAPVEAAQTLAIAPSISRFVPKATVVRIKRQMLERVMSDRATAAEAAQEAEDRINDEIERTLRESPTLRRRHAELMRTQEQIDARRRKGQPVPRTWIANTFHEHYYAFKGWLE